MHGSSMLLLRFSVEAGTLLRKKQGLWESLFITFRDQCVFLWQQAERWDTWDPPRALHTAIILPAVLTAVVMEAEHTPWWGEISNKPIDWPSPIPLCCEVKLARASILTALSKSFAAQTFLKTYACTWVECYFFVNFFIFKLEKLGKNPKVPCVETENGKH